MKEYNWRKEREKYQALPDKNEQPAAPAPQPGSGLKKTGLLSMLLTVATLVAIVSWLVVHYTIGDSLAQLSAAAAKHEAAVGLVSVTFNIPQGKKVVVPVGTAWAFAPDKFATNAHVVSAIKGLYKSQIRAAAVELLSLQAIKENYTSLDAFCQSKGTERAQELLRQAEKEIAAAVSPVKVRITINGTSKSYDVVKWGIHPDYNERENNYNPDVAVLTIAGQHTTTFKIASPKKLHELKRGCPIAFLGFPMENLDNNNINLDKPAATMQSGIISNVTDFSLREQKDPAANVFIRHNLPATGGASGSPIFTKDGKVVAMLYGGNVIYKKESGERTPSAAQINFAVRIDLLHAVKNAADINTLFELGK